VVAGTRHPARVDPKNRIHGRVLDVAGARAIAVTMIVCPCGSYVTRGIREIERRAPVSTAGWKPYDGIAQALPNARRHSGPAGREGTR